MQLAITLPYGGDAISLLKAALTGCPPVPRLGDLSNLRTTISELLFVIGQEVLALHLLLSLVLFDAAYEYAHTGRHQLRGLNVLFLRRKP